MSAAHFLDTNILLYAISRNPGESSKRDIAVGLLDANDWALSVQVLQEFYVQATRPTRTGALAHEVAVGFIETWTRVPVQETTMSVLMGALAIKAAHGFSYWDSAVIAAARALGCRVLYSEDMAHGREVEGILITNPFR